MSARNWSWSALVLVVDVENVEVEAEEDGIKIKVIVDRSKPSASVVDALESNVAREGRKSSDWLALIG